ncbi:hypothetical protein ABPG73_008636 [Tetrahymena malaccensis]
MKSLDSGGCISNLGASILFFTNTLFDSCLSGMFGGALYTSGINITDQLIIKNSKSKIGGGAFVGSPQCNAKGIDKINFYNDSNSATISSQKAVIVKIGQDMEMIYVLKAIQELNVQYVILMVNFGEENHMDNKAISNV